MIPCQKHLFDIPEDVTYLNCAFTSPLLRTAAAAGQEALRVKSNPWHLRPQHFFDTLTENRKLFAQLISSSPENIAIIPAASYGAALAAGNIPLTKGQCILMLEDQFPSNVYAWQRVAEEKEAEIITVPRPPDSDWTSAVLRAIDNRTDIAALQNCHWTDGTRVDLKKVGEKCRQVGAALVVDGMQSLGAMPFSVEEVQPDFLFAGSHKWLLGAYSFGFCYIAPRWQNGIPLEENWLNRKESEDFSRLVEYRDAYQPGAARYDMGEASNFILAPIAAAALKQILEWKVGHIADSLEHLTGRIAEKAGKLGLGVAAKDFRSPHMIGLSIPGGLPEKLPEMLADEKIYISIRGSSIRVAPHLYNTEKDIDRLFYVLEKVLKN